MTDEHKPVTTPPDAGTGTEPQGTPAPDVTGRQESSVDVDAVIALLDESDKTIEKVEKWGVGLKKKLKGITATDTEDDPREQEIMELHKRVLALEGLQAGSSDKELAELSTLRTRNAELRAVLVSAKTAQTASLGTNQDTTTPDKDPMAGMNASQIALYERIARKHNMTVREYLATLNKK